MAGSVLITFALVSFVLLLSRLSGFLRELLLASQLGTGQSADAAILMLTFPDFMVGFLLAGGLSAAIIPALKKSEPVARLQLIRRIMLQTTVCFAVLAAGLAIGAEYVISALAPSLGENPFPGFKDAFRLSMLALPMIAIVGALTSYLNTVGKFALPSVSVLMFNLIICVYLAVILTSEGSFTGLAMTLILATFARVILQVTFAREIFTSTAGETRLPTDRALLGKFAFGVISYGVIVGAPIAFRAAYALNGEGYLAVFSFSMKLFDLPAALLVAPLIAILLPKLAALSDLGRTQIQDHVVQAMGVSLAFVSIALASGWIFMPMIVDIIYLRGAMTVADTAHITKLARLFFTVLPFYAMMHLGAIGLSAQGQVKRVFLITLASFLFSFAVTYALHTQGNELAAIWGFIVFYVCAAGLSLATVLGARFVSWDTWRGVVIVGLKSCVVALPFVILRRSEFAVQELLPQVGLLLLCCLCLAAIQFSAFRTLYRMRVDTT